AVVGWLGEVGVVGEEWIAGRHQVERGSGLAGAGRSGQRRRAAVPGHGRRVEQQVPACEDRARVAVVDEIDRLIEIPGDVTGRPRVAGPDAHQHTRRALENETLAVAL